MAGLTITLDRTEELALRDRADRLIPKGEPPQMTPMVEAALFLRGVRSRAALALPAFYLHLGAVEGSNADDLVQGYPGVVLRHVVGFSSLSTLTLAVAKAFDNAPKGNGLTGARFAHRTDDDTLGKVAVYWADKSGQPHADALSALAFLRSVFREFAVAEKVLFASPAPLAKRIGLIRQYRKRVAAHLSVDAYELSIGDCAHVVAALATIGAIIGRFDNPEESHNYFDELDQAAATAAKQVFHATPDVRLFGKVEVSMQSRVCWQWGHVRGLKWLAHDLPYATGWY